ncbi:ABC transporter substrate-binding protein [Xanthobacter sp. V4C-4]|uniref:ABC transporter substrate-binding protein n=1 Tax=Xanthobacter cornucopiae TaxID=3119924 RepID=UPI00372A3923
MTHSFNPLRRLVLAAGLALPLAGGLVSGLAHAADKAAAAPEKIAIGISNRSLLGLPVVVAKERGFFAEEGLDVGIDYFAGGTPATAALIGGSVQFIDAAFENNIKAVKNGQKLVSVLNLQTDFAGAVIVRKDVADKLAGKPTVADLKGLKIGTLARGGFADVSTRYILADAGLDAEKDVTLVPIRGADRQLTAGEAGEIEAAFVMEPWSVIAVEKSNKWAYVLNITTGEGPKVFQGLGYITLQTTRDYVKTNRPIVEKVVRALVKAQSYIVDPANIDALAAIADREYGGSGVDVVKISLARQAHSFAPALSPENVAKTSELLLKSGAIAAPAPSFDEVVDTSFAPLWSAFRK